MSPRRTSWLAISFAVASMALTAVNAGCLRWPGKVAPRDPARPPRQEAPAAPAERSLACARW